MSFLEKCWGKMAYDELRCGAARTTGASVTADAALPLVLLHGTGCDTADWLPMVAALPGDQRVISVEFRGHGSSDVPAHGYGFADMAEDVARLAEHLRLARYVIAGHSMGGMVAMQVAERSAAVRGIVSLEGWPKALATRAFAPEHDMGRMSAAMVAEVERKLTATQARYRPEVWAALCDSGGRFDATAWLARATIPVWHIYGTLGRQPDSYDRLHVPANPMMRFIWLDGCGHYVPHEKPIESARLCAEALAAWR